MESGATFLDRLGEFVRRYRYLVVAIWVLLAAGLNVAIPQLESVVSEHSTRFVPEDAPSTQVAQEMGREFKESTTTGLAYLVLERDTGLTDADHAYYDTVVRAIVADREHIESVMDLWSTPVTAGSVVSQDAKAVYLLAHIAGDPGSTRASQSVEAMRSAVDSVPRPDGMTARITGPAVTASDELDGVQSALLTITAITVVLIAALLIGVYRSFFVASIPLTTIGLTLAVSRQTVAFFGAHGVETSIFSVALLAAMILGGGTDYAIFSISRYHEARRAGRTMEQAYGEAYRTISPVLIASGLIIALTCSVMSFAHIGLFRTVGLPSAIGILVVIVASVTLTPACLAIIAERGWAEPKGKGTAHYWQSLASIVERRPARVLTGSLLVVALFGSILFTLDLSYDERTTMPDDAPSNKGYATAAQHYPENELLPSYLLIQSDHDMRTPKDFAALEQISAKLAEQPGVQSVRGVTRPLGGPIAEAAVGYQVGVLGDRLGSAAGELTAAQPEVARLDTGATQLADGSRQLTTGTGQLAAGALGAQAGSAQLVDGTRQLDNGLSQAVAGTAQLSGGAQQLRSGAAELAQGVSTATAPAQPLLGALEALRGTVAADPNCSANPVCAAAQATLAALDGSALGQTVADLGRLTTGAQQLATGAGQLSTGADQLLAALTTMQAGSAQLLSGQLQLDGGLGTLATGARQVDDGTKQLADGAGQVQAGVSQIATRMGALPAGLNEASSYLEGLQIAVGNRGDGGGFYLPTFAMQDENLKIAQRFYLSEDGRAARLIVTDSGNAFGVDGMARTQRLTDLARDAAQSTVLADSRIGVSGVTATYIDLKAMAWQDLRLIMLVASILILVVLAFMLRSLVAPLYILGSVVVSYAAALGLSVLLWQHLLDKPLHWAVPPMSFIALIAVGADYNLLLMSRVRDELDAAPAGGTRAAINRALTRTGGVITTAGVVFAITMFAMISSPITNIAQVGFTIGIGLLLDTLLVRTMIVPAVATLLGEHNWWPSKRGAVRPTMNRAPELLPHTGNGARDQASLIKPETM